MKYLKEYNIFDSEIRSEELGPNYPITMKAVELSEEQKNFLNTCTGTKDSPKSQIWYINRETGLINTTTNFNCSVRGLKDLKGINFGIISGNFDCSNNKISSLIGSPRKCAEFFCHDNYLESLEGGPEEVKGTYNCSNNSLTSFKGAPKKVGRMICTGNAIRSMEGFPYIENINETSVALASNPVSRDTLLMINDMMKKSDLSYGHILAYLKNQIPENDWYHLDKTEYIKIKEGVKKGYNLLGKIEEK